MMNHLQIKQFVEATALLAEWPPEAQHNLYIALNKVRDWDDPIRQKAIVQALPRYGFDAAMWTAEALGIPEPTFLDRISAGAYSGQEVCRALMLGLAKFKDELEHGEPIEDDN